MGTSFATIFGVIPPLLCRHATGAFDVLTSEPIAKLGLATGYTDDSKKIEGVYEGFGSVLETACPGLVNGCRVEAQRYGDDGFDVRITLNSALTPHPRYTNLSTLELLGAFLYIRCTKKLPADAGAGSSVDLVWLAKPKGQPVSFVHAIHIPQLMTGYFECSYLRYSSTAETAATGVAAEDGADMATLVGDELGFVPDFATLLPSTMPYASSTRVRSVMRTPALGSASDKPGICVELELLHNAGLESQVDGAVVIEDLAVLVGAAQPGRASSLFVEMRGVLTLAGVPVHLSASYPEWRVSVDVLPSQPLPLADIAAACGMKVPAALQEVALASGHARFDLSSGGNRGAVSLSRLDCEIELAFSAGQQHMDCLLAPADASVTAAFDYGSVAIGKRGGAVDVHVRGDVAFRTADGSHLFSLAAEGALARGGASTTLQLRAFLRPAYDSEAQSVLEDVLGTEHAPGAEGTSIVRAYPSFSQVFTALTGRTLPAGCPAVELRELSVALAYDKSLVVQAFAGAVRVATSDRSVFGCDLSFTAGVAYRATGLAELPADALGSSPFGRSVKLPDTAGVTTLTGGFLLAERFALSATVTIAQTTTWAFSLVLGTSSLALAYDKGVLSAIIDTDLSLGDAADALLRLFDRTASFDRTGAWSFLNGISLKGASLTYSFAQKRLRMALTPSCSVPFLQMDGFAVTVDPVEGVTFEMTGAFDGEEYPASKPLIFEPNEPPRPSGNALRVDYLALADGIAVDGLRGGVEASLKRIEETLSGSTDPTALVVNPAAGALMGADFSVAQCAQVKLVFSGGTLVMGGRMCLYGPKAGPFDGLEAEFGYAKITNQLGVFSADFVPPASLRHLVLGSLTLGVGHMSAQVYTNGDFTIDLGFPAGGDFSRSFTLSYGVFDGAGGAYLKRLSTLEGSTVPSTARGRFSPVLQLGVGMRLALAKGFSAGLLSANASFSLQGLFEGVYATFLPYSSTGSASYYRLDATVALDGRVQGSVNFGLVGAAVTVQAHASAALRLEAYRAASVTVEVNVAARAQVRILFVRISFSFDLAARIEFELGAGGVAPWAASAPRLRDGVWDAPPAVPACAFTLGGDRRWAAGPLAFPPVEGAPRTVVCRVAPVYTVCAGDPAAVLLASVTADDFAVIVDALASFSQLNGMLGEPGTLELFSTVQLFAHPDDLYRFLSERFVFEFAFVGDSGPRAFGEPNGLAADDVLMPLPGFFVQSLETRYATGVTDVQEADLSTCSVVDEEFVQRMREYYAKTSEDNAWLTSSRAQRERAADDPGTASPRERGDAWSLSLAAKQFVDYFQLIVTCVRAQEESAAVRGERFAAGQLTSAQASNIAGAVQRFLLGGHRVLDEDEADERGRVHGHGRARAQRRRDDAACGFSGDEPLLGNFEAAGELAYLEVEDEQVTGFCFRLAPSETCPGWIRLRDGASHRELEVEQVRAALPALCFSDASRFVEPPTVRPYFVEVPAPAFKLPVTFADKTTRWFDAGEQMAPGRRYTFKGGEGARIRFAGRCTLTLLNCACDPPLFAIVGSTRTKDIGLWRSAAALGNTEGVRLIAETPSGAPVRDGDATGEGRPIRALPREATDSSCYLLKGMDGSLGELVQASLDDQRDWLVLLELACASEEPYYLGYRTREACPFADEDRVEVHVVVRHAPAETFPEGFDVIEAAPCASDWLEVVPEGTVAQTVLPQGRVAVTARVNAEALPEDERALSDLYASMAVRRIRTGSHETPPFTAREEKTSRTLLAEYAGNPPSADADDFLGDQRFTVLFPYALEDDDRYTAVRAKEPLALQVMWVDMFGNSMDDPQQTVSFLPHYIDDLIPFGAYPGMQAGYRLIESQGKPALSVELRYRPEAHDLRRGAQRSEQPSAALADAVAQLEQPDVTFTLVSPIANHPELDKEAWLVFLRSLCASPGESASYEQVVVLKNPPTFSHLKASVVVKREASLVEPGAPTTVHQAITQLTFFDDRPLPASIAVYEGAGTRAVLGAASPPLAAKDGWFYAFKPLPLVTGCFCAPQAPAGAGEDYVQMNAVDLQSVLEDFLADLATFSQPVMLARLATTPALREFVLIVQRVHAKVGPVLANLLAPVSSTPPTPKAEEAARDACAAAIRLNPHLDLARVVVGGVDMEHRIPSVLDVRVHGIVGEGAGFPTRVIPEGALGFALSCDDGRIDCSELRFKVKRLRRRAWEAREWYDPLRGEEGFDEVPLNLAGVLQLPGFHRPAPPAVLMAVPESRSLTVAMSVAPYACDEMEFWLDDGTDEPPLYAGEPSPTPSPVYWMERYRRDAPALVASGADEDVAALAALMMKYVDALAAYRREADAAYRDVTENPQVTLSVVANESGRFTDVFVRGDAQRVTALLCRVGEGSDVAAIREDARDVDAGGADARGEGARFRLDNSVLPRAGEPFVLTVTFAVPGTQPMGGWVRLAYRPTIVEGEARSLAFDQESARISF